MSCDVVGYPEESPPPIEYFQGHRLFRAQQTRFIVCLYQNTSMQHVCTRIQVCNMFVPEYQYATCLYQNTSMQHVCTRIPVCNMFVPEYTVCNMFVPEYQYATCLYQNTSMQHVCTTIPVCNLFILSCQLLISSVVCFVFTSLVMLKFHL
jgi:hypothetical protein